MNVVFIIYRRPDLTRKVFDRIRAAKPARLLIVADGPKTHEEGELCQACRRVVESVDWPCDVHRNYSEVNLGCRQRLISGLDWVFTLVEEAIILEDDCLPDPSFFLFCSELLCKYRDEPRVMAVSGDNFQTGISHSRNSYSFSKYVFIWGWATWRRAWRLNNPELSLWNTPDELKRVLSHCDSTEERIYWEKRFQGVVAGCVDTWDYGWLFSLWYHEGLTVVPAQNLVENIGFGVDGCHTTEEVGGRLHRDASAIRFPLKHPACIVASAEHDADVFRNVLDRANHERRGLWHKLLARCRKVGCGVRWRWNVLATWLPSRLSAIAAGIVGLPGVAFYWFGVKCGRRCLNAGVEDLGWELYLTPVSHIRFFEFDFADRQLGFADVRTHLDISSSRLFLAHTLERFPNAQLDMVNPDARDLDASGRMMTCLPIDGMRVRYHESFCRNLPWPDASFDLVSSISVIEHIPAPMDTEAVREMWRLVRPGGLLVLTTGVAVVLWDEYRDYDPYELRTQNGTEGPRFFAHWYDESAIDGRILSHLTDGEVLQREIWTERRSGWFKAYQHRWLTRGTKETRWDPLLMVTGFRRCPDLRSLKGDGVACWSVRKRVAERRVNG